MAPGLEAEKAEQAVEILEPVLNLLSEQTVISQARSSPSQGTHGCSGQAPAPLG